MGTPILNYAPSGGVPPSTVVPPLPPITNGEFTPLISGQSYIDVVFAREQSSTDWIFVDCSVINLIDLEPLNIWPGIITDKTVFGFRLQLNGMPDSNNYYLNWAISGVNAPPPAPFPATTYILSGPSGGYSGVASTAFTVRLPLGGTVASPVTVTPSDSGAGGTFSPTTIMLTTGASSGVFTYTPASPGSKGISTTNDGVLVNPAGIIYNSLTPVYILTGPSFGVIGEVSTPFTVTLLGGVAGTLTVTPSDGGAGGTFTPTSVGLTVAAPSATFTYTPASSGTKTISTTNTGGLTNPASIGYSVTAPTYSLSGPSGGIGGVPSTDFTVVLAVTPPLSGSVIVTPSSGGGGGTFTPTTVTVTTAAPSATFTYTPASGGVKIISVTNNRGLTNPSSVNYTSIAPLVDGDPVTTWKDSSIAGNDATQTVTLKKPVFKTSIVGGKPVVRFASANSQGLDLASVIEGAAPWTAFVVSKPATTGSDIYSLACTDASLPATPYVSSDGNIYIGVWGGAYVQVVNTWTGAFHVFSAISNTPASSAPLFYVDGTNQTGSFFSISSGGHFSNIGYRGSTPNYSNGDLAEIIIYNVVLSGTDRANIEKYLGTKYGITVAGGTAAQPDSVTGLQGWWKADSLG